MQSTSSKSLGTPPLRGAPQSLVAQRSNMLPLAAAVCLAAALSACASTPVPYEKIAVAKASLQRAEQSGAPQLAPVEMATARDKLSRAEKAVANNETQPATLLAEQANVDAELAEATAVEHKSHQAATEFDASMQALRQESARATPLTQ